MIPTSPTTINGRHAKDEVDEFNWTTSKIWRMQWIRTKGGKEIKKE